MLRYWCAIVLILPQLLIAGSNQASGVNLTFVSHLLPVSFANVKFMNSTSQNDLASGPFDCDIWSDSAAKGSKCRNRTISAAAPLISAAEAFAAASAGELVLVDIRTPQEWRETGIGAPAHAISMHGADFFDRLAELIGPDRSRAIALICATGGRSAFMQFHLRGRGYTNVQDVGEGMLGGRSGPGWIRAGLPIKPYP